jgi:hypothetical protein
VKTEDIYHLVKTWELAHCIRILDVHSASFQQKQRLPLTSFLGQLRSGVWPKRGSLECYQIAQAAQHSDLRTCFRAKPSFKYSVPISLLIFLSFGPLIRIIVKLSLLAVSTDFYSVTALFYLNSTSFISKHSLQNASNSSNPRYRPGRSHSDVFRCYAQHAWHERGGHSYYQLDNFCCYS